MAGRTTAASPGNGLDATLEVAKAAYAGKRPNSAHQDEWARRFLPGGSTRSVLDFDPYPFRVEFADGCELVDVDGHRYVDFLADYTAGLLGHSPPEIKHAVQAAMRRGWSLGALADEEHQLAALLCDRFPSFQLMRFTNSGTEANMMAITLARHHTGRSKVMVFEGAYHGGMLSFSPGGAGTLAPFDYVRCPYNDLDAVSSALAEHLDVACIVAEPMMGAGGSIRGRHDFLAGLRDVCRDTGVVLIFDEVMTSRMSIGGAQRRLAIRPDMTTLGKYLGGGMTFGAFGGRADIMRSLDPMSGGTLTHGGTFNNNVITMAAGMAATDLLTPDSLDRLFAAGEEFRTELSAALAPAGMSALGWGSLMTVHALTGVVDSPVDLAGADPRIGELFFHLMLDRGYYIGPRGFLALSLAVTKRERSGFIEATKLVVDDMLGCGAILPVD